MRSLSLLKSAVSIRKEEHINTSFTSFLRKVRVFAVFLIITLKIAICKSNLLCDGQLKGEIGPVIV